MSGLDSNGSSADIVQKLKDVLIDLHHHPYPIIDNPPGLKKRASVAVILRINPTYSNWPSEEPAQLSHISAQNEDVQSSTERLESFFSQKWVQEGDPEVLFIKRSARKGDRWQGHVALPGGGRDPEDADDKVTAVRETKEEVGIDLSESNAIEVGNLPQRLVTSSWGKVPLMILCPYIFLVARHDLPPLRLQPTEIGSAHWVPLQMLLSADMRTYEYQDVSSRLAKQEFGIKRMYYQGLFGQMQFGAVRLVPSESLFCTASTGYTPLPPKTSATWLQTIADRIQRNRKHEARTFSPPLLLWGLTLNVMADLLTLLPPYNAIHLWTYPNFTAPDVGFMIWLFSYNFRKRKFEEAKKFTPSGPASVEVGLDSVPVPRGSQLQIPGGWGSSRINFMLDGYFEIIRRGAAIALLARTTAFVASIYMLWQRYRHRP